MKALKAMGISVVSILFVGSLLYALGILMTGETRPWEWAHTAVFGVAMFIVIALSLVAGVASQFPESFPDHE